MSRRGFPFALAIFMASGSFGGQAAASSVETPDPAPYAPGEIVVRYLPGVDEGEQAEARAALDASVEDASEATGLEVLAVPEGTDPQQAAAAAESLPQVLYAEPNYAYRIAAVPNDPKYRDQWPLHPSNRSGMNSGIDAPSAWNATTGSPSVTVAVVDSGVDSAHPDLAPNIWTNPAETGGREANGTDDDGNGFVDDWRGWDWTEDDNDPADALGHGTHTAGTIGAVGNNGVGVSGVNWHVRLMPLRVIDASGVGYATDVAEAFTYAARAGAQVVNASLSGPEMSQAMYEAIAAAPQTLFVVAAGNEGKDNDVSPSYPCNIDLPNVVCVTATGQFNELTPFSNWGARSVDLAAPGMRIVSTWPGGGYAEGMGTSAATPHVSGTAALAWSRVPGGALAVRDRLLGSVEPIPELQGRTVTGGRVNAASALGQKREDTEELRGDRNRCKKKARHRQGQRRRHRNRCRSRR
jgi:subtilisin family serine protease